MVQPLLENGVDLNAKQDNKTALGSGCYPARTGCVLQ